MPTRFLSRSHANSFLPTDPWRTAETHESLENGRDPRTQDRRQNGVASMQHCEFIQLFGQHSKDDREDRDTWHPPRRDTMEAKSNPTTTTTTTMTTTRITTTRTPPRRTGRMPERCRGAITISAQGTRRPRTSETQTQDKAINHDKDAGYTAQQLKSARSLPHANRGHETRSSITTTETHQGNALLPTRPQRHPRRPASLRATGSQGAL